MISECPESVDSAVYMSIPNCGGTQRLVAFDCHRPRKYGESLCDPVKQVSSFHNGDEWLAMVPQAA
jgi:hypothetical protein